MMHFFKHMKKRYKILISAIIIIVFIAFIYFFMTPEGALRKEVFFHGFPRKAVVMTFSGIADSAEKSDANSFHFVIADPPHNSKTDTYEENWLVTKNGLIYSAECID